MRRQPPSGRPAYHIFNLGFSAWGRKLSATSCTHKATKTALSALTEALGDDLRAVGEAWACAQPTLLAEMWQCESDYRLPVAVIF
jgi:short-subunit dehydrogenase